MSFFKRTKENKKTNQPDKQSQRHTLIPTPFLMQKDKAEPGTFPSGESVLSREEVKLTGSSHWSLKMLATFLDLWKQWQRANQNLILDKGKGGPTRHQHPFHVGQRDGAIHTFPAEVRLGARGACWGHGSRHEGRWGWGS